MVRTALRPALPRPELEVGREGSRWRDDSMGLRLAELLGWAEVVHALLTLMCDCSPFVVLLERAGTNKDTKELRLKLRAPAATLLARISASVEGRPPQLADVVERASSLLHHVVHMLTDELALRTLASLGLAEQQCAAWAELGAQLGSLSRARVVAALKTRPTKPC